MYAVMVVFLVGHIPQELWAILHKIGLVEVVQRLEEWLLTFLTAGYLS